MTQKAQGTKEKIDNLNIEIKNLYTLNDTLKKVKIQSTVQEKH